MADSGGTAGETSEHPPEPGRVDGSVGDGGDQFGHEISYEDRGRTRALVGSALVMTDKIVGQLLRVSAADPVGPDLHCSAPDRGPERHRCACRQELRSRLDQTAMLTALVKAVEALGRRIVAAKADVRDLAALTGVLDDGVAQLGRLDIVSANAGIGLTPQLAADMPGAVWRDMIDINLTGVWHTVKAAIPHIVNGERGGSIALTSSCAGLKGQPNMAHYVAAKHGVVGLMKSLALELAQHRIRVNAILPTQVPTDMILNEDMYRLFRPDLDNPTRADFEPVSQSLNALPVPWVEPVDVSNALLFLASDEARYITGVAMPVDAGMLIR